MAAPTAPVHGSRGKIYVRYGNLWGEVANVRDVETPLKRTKTKITGRYSGGVETYEPTSIDLDFSLTMLHNPNDINLQSFLDAFWLGLPLDMLVLNQSKNVTGGGAQGVRCIFKVFDHNRKETLDGVMEDMFGFAPGFDPSATVAPISRVTVASAAQYA